MKPLKLNFDSNPNIGLFLFANNKFCLIGKGINKKYYKQIEQTLNVPVIPISVIGTDLTGIFIAGNDHFILAPELMFEDEKEELNKICNNFKCELIIINDKITALHNCSLINNHFALFCKEFSKSTREKIKRLLSNYNIKFDFNNLDSMPLIGSYCVLNNKKCVLSNIFSNEIEEEISHKFNVEVIKLSVNFGNNVISSGLCMNDYGYIIGDLTTPIELYELDNFLRDENE